MQLYIDSYPVPLACHPSEYSAAFAGIFRLGLSSAMSPGVAGSVSYPLVY